MATLTIHSGPGKGRTFRISGEPQSIGRAGDFQILDTSASRKHAEVFKLGEMLFVRDLSSRNGTFVNDQKIEKETHLRSGDHIRIGASVLVFDSGSVHEEPHEFVQGSAPGAGTVEIRLGADAQVVSGATSTSEKSLNRLVAMYDIARILGCEQTVQGILEKVIDASMQVIKPTYCYLFIRDEIGDRLIPKAWRDPVTDQRRAISRSIVNRAMKHRHSILTADAGSDRRFFKSESVVTASIKSVICAPLISRDRINGVIYLGRDITQFTDADLELATAVAFQAGIALENAHVQNDRRTETITVVKTLIGASDLRCPGLRGHSERVAAYAAAIAEGLKLGPDEAEEVTLAALLHDIGKVDITENTRLAVSSAVGRIVPHEYCHPWLGAKILEEIPAMKNILPGIKYHHERLDGFGGPEGLVGENVPVIARIVAVANRFDHLAADVMPDGTQYTINEALELIEQPGEGLDDAITAALVNAQKSGTGISLPKLVLQDYC